MAGNGSRAHSSVSSGADNSLIWLRFVPFAMASLPGRAAVEVVGEMVVLEAIHVPAADDLCSVVLPGRETGDDGPEGDSPSAAMHIAARFEAKRCREGEVALTVCRITWRSVLGTQNVEDT
jgi:hypothetical protein